MKCTCMLYTFTHHLVKLSWRKIAPRANGSIITSPRQQEYIKTERSRMWCPCHCLWWSIIPHEHKCWLCYYSTIYKLPFPSDQCNVWSTTRLPTFSGTFSTCTWGMDLPTLSLSLSSVVLRMKKIWAVLKTPFFINLTIPIWIIFHR